MGVVAGLVEALARAGAFRVAKPLVRRRAVILMLHRFREPDVTHDGYTPATLRDVLSELRRQRYRLVGLDDLTARLADGRPPEPESVVFTVDDGYRDFHRIALPIFAEFDCPATVFLVTGFLDGETWPWWNQVEVALGSRSSGELRLALRDGELRLSWRDEREGERVLGVVLERLKRASDDELRAAIPRIAEATGTALPTAPPERFAPMSWDEVRDAERRGMRFGPHTVTHPILSRTTAVAAEREIARSWARVREEVAHPVGVFCYPNGDRESFGEREERLVAAQGLRLALTTVPGYASAEAVRGGGAFRVPRFACPDNARGLHQIASGFLRLRSASLRG
jgi:peptidoglycan/xylan/chitin deacetylase (PgdA/CDA1 family)